jgi:hypothetical protein
MTPLKYENLFTFLITNSSDSKQTIIRKNVEKLFNNNLNYKP